LVNIASNRGFYICAYPIQHFWEQFNSNLMFNESIKIKNAFHGVHKGLKPIINIEIRLF